MILAISSTTIIIKALEELGKTKERFAQQIFGILIVEDILAIVMIALLSGFATTGSLEAAAVGETVMKLSAFLGVLLVAGLIAVPRLLEYVARFRSNEMLLITALGLCFGVSLIASEPMMHAPDKPHRSQGRTNQRRATAPAWLMCRSVFIEVTVDSGARIEHPAV